MTARGFSPSYIGAMGVADLDECDLARCERCREVCELGELEDGRCADCQPQEMTTAEELRP